MARIGRIVKSLYKRRASAPGKSVVVQIVGQAGEERTAEFYHPPGISSAPTPEDRAVIVPIGSGGFRIVIATHNYRVEVEAGAGETIIYSTNAGGDAVTATIKLDAAGNIQANADGNIDLNGSAKKLVTHAELNTALQTFIATLNLHVHGAAGTPPVTPMSLDISAAQTSSVRTGG
jgi:hypothetical protein